MTTIPPASHSTWRTHLRELWHYRYLLYNLVVRDLKVRYKNSVLGVLWSILNPLFIMIVFTLVFDKFSGSGQIDAYPIFVLVGIIPWNFFSGSIIGGTNGILGNASLIKKVYFPREILPTATILSNLVNFLIALLVMFVMLYAFGIGLSIHALWLPVILLTQLLFMLGLVYFLSAAQVFYRDVAMILDVGMLAFFFLTPIFYTVDQFCNTTLLGITFDPGRLMRWLNPMASIIDAYRTVLWGTLVYPVETCAQGISTYSPPAGMGLDFVGRTLLTSVIVLIAGYAFFRRAEWKFGELL